MVCEWQLSDRWQTSILDGKNMTVHTVVNQVTKDSEVVGFHVDPGYAFPYPDEPSHLRALARWDIFRCPIGETSCVGFELQGETIPIECADDYTGFLCSACGVGTIKLSGICTPCEGVNVPLLALQIVVTFMMALFLLHMATTAVVSVEQIRHIWTKIDSRETGILTVDKVKEVLELLRGPISDDKLKQVVAKLDKAETDELLRPGLVKAETFVEYYRAQCPTQTLPTTIFFLQTVALVLQEAKYFDFVEVLNLDAAEATATCMLPIGSTGQFYQKSVVVPVSILLFGLVSVPLWNFLRRSPSAGCCLAKRQKIHAKVWDRMQKPNVVTVEHIRRAQMASYLYVLTPVTQAAVGMLICRPMSETCTEDLCTAVLVLDPSIECTHVDYYRTQAVATTIVLLMIVAIRAHPFPIK